MNPIIPAPNSPAPDHAPTANDYHTLIHDFYNAQLIDDSNAIIAANPELTILDSLDDLTEPCAAALFNSIPLMNAYDALLQSRIRYLIINPA